MSFRPLNTQNSQGQNYGQINDMVRQLNKEQKVKVFKGDGENQVLIGKLPNDEGYGLYLTDGTVTTIITAASITQNDGTNDRLFLGNEA